MSCRQLPTGRGAQGNSTRPSASPAATKSPRAAVAGRTVPAASPIKKLASLGLVTTGRIGKEKSAAITANGASLCQKYRDIRKERRVNTVKRLQLDENTLSAIAAPLRALSGNFDRAARAAASLSATSIRHGC